MPAEVRLFVFNLVGQRTIASSPKVMDRIAAYARDARRCGLSDAELRDDIARFWPSTRRVIEVETAPGAEVWVSMTPSRQAAAALPNAWRRTAASRRPAKAWHPAAHR